MRAFIAEMFKFMQGRPDHPVYRREMAGWSYVRMWRGLRQGCLPLILIMVVVTSACCGLMTLVTVTQESVEPDWIYRLLLTIGAGVFGAFWIGEVVLQIAGLIATVLTSTSVSAEMEADTFGLVRLTLVSPREIVLAKFGAAVRELRLPVIAVLVTRTLFLVAIPLLLIVAGIYGISTVAGAPGGSSSPSSPGGAVSSALLPASMLALVPLLTTSALGLASLVIAGALGLFYYFIQPALDMMLFSAVGVAGSTLARTRASGLFAGFGLRVGLWAGACMINQIVSNGISIVLTPALVLPATNNAIGDMLANNPGMLIALYGFAMAAFVLILIIAQFVTTIALLRFAESRASRLPYNV